MAPLIAGCTSPGLKQSGKTGARLKSNCPHASRRTRSVSSQNSSSYWRKNEELREFPPAVVCGRVEKPSFRSQARPHGHAAPGSVLERTHSYGAQLRYFRDSLIDTKPQPLETLLLVVQH